MKKFGETKQVPVCFGFLSPKSAFWKKLNQLLRLVNSKRLFYKSCVLSTEKKLRTNAEGIMDPQGSINENALYAFCILPLQTRKIPKYISSLTPSSLICVFFLRLLPLCLPLLLHRSTPTINKTHFNLWYSEHKINKTKPKITQNQHKNNLKSTQIRKTHPKLNSKSTQNP